MESLNTRSLQQHHDDVMKDYNIQSSYILCLNKTRINVEQDSTNWSRFINVKKIKIVSCYGEHSTMMMYDSNMILCIVK